jgi:hypothetical protein
MAGCISNSNPSRLGGGARGVQPKGGLLGGGGGSSGGSGMVGGGERGRDRLVLRKAFGRFMVIDAARDDVFGDVDGFLYAGAAFNSNQGINGGGGGACWRCFDSRFDCPPGRSDYCNARSGAPGSERCDPKNWLDDNPAWPKPSATAACDSNKQACDSRRDRPDCPPGCCLSPSGLTPSGTSGGNSDFDLLDDDYMDLDGDGYADPTPGTCARDVLKMPLTPFRQAFNAGDSQGTVNNSVLAELYAPNQVGGIGAGQNIFSRAGGVHKGGQAAYTGNPKYVYDGSDYIRFKKLQAKNRTYNDKSFGGANNGAYVPLMRMRH